MAFLSRLLFYLTHISSAVSDVTSLILQRFLSVRNRSRPVFGYVYLNLHSVSVD